MRVASNSAVSLDGRINTRERRFAFFGSPRDHARMSRLRAGSDAVLVGGATFRNWPHPALPDTADRVLLEGRRPWNVVVSRGLDLPPDGDLTSDPQVRPLFLTRASAAREVPGAEVAGYDGPGDDLPVDWILAQLASRGVERLLVEAGGELLFQFFAADAIDDVHLTLCPLVVGGDAPSLADGAGFDLDTMKRFSLVAVEPEGDEVFLHYARRGAGEIAP